MFKIINLCFALLLCATEQAYKCQRLKKQAQMTQRGYLLNVIGVDKKQHGVKMRYMPIF